MSIQIWEIKGKIIGNFLLLNQENINSSIPPPHPAMCGFFISPEFDKDNEQTGIFNINITFKIDATEEKPPANRLQI